VQWNHSNTIGLAQSSCMWCEGLGMRPVRDMQVPCKCVFRAIFRRCFDRFKSCVASQGRISSTCKPEMFSHGSSSRVSYGRRNEEFLADFCMLAKRALTPEEHRLFRYHLLLGADWKLCFRQLKMTCGRQTFFYKIWCIEEKLGRIFAETKPYGLWPLDMYFHTVVSERPVTACPVPKKRAVLRPPMQAA